MDAFRESVDPLALEVIAIEDRIGIELDVSSAGQPALRTRPIFPAVRSAQLCSLYCWQEEIAL